MTISNAEAIKRYELVRNEIREHCPEIWDEVAQLSRAVPATIDFTRTYAN